MGSCWGKQKVWLTASPDKYHPRPQTDKSSRDDVTGIRPPPARALRPARSRTSLVSAAFVICFFAERLVQTRFNQTSHRTSLCSQCSRCFYSSQTKPADPHFHAKIVLLCDCHLPGQTWAVFNRLPLCPHQPRHPATSCRCEFSLMFVARHSASYCIQKAANWGVRQPGDVAPAWFSSAHITYMLNIHRSGIGRNVFTAVLAHCSSDITPPPCLPE